MSAEARRVLHALLARTGARMDDLEARIARLEQCPPTPLGGRELQRQRVEAVLRARADGFSHRQIAGATGVSQLDRLDDAIEPSFDALVEVPSIDDVLAGL